MLQWTSWNVMECHGICIAMPSYWNILKPVPSSTSRSPFPIPSPRQLQGALNEFRSAHEDRLHQVLKNSPKLSRLQNFGLLSCSTRLYNFYIFSHPYGYSSVQALQPFATQHDFSYFSNDPTSTICSTVPVAHLAPLAFKPWICHVHQRRRSWGK